MRVINGVATNEWFKKSTKVALAAISGTVLGTGDFAFVFENGNFFPWRYNAAGTAAESDTVVRPYDFATVGAGNWEFQVYPGSQMVNRSTVNPENDIFGGDASISTNTITVQPYSCLDSTGTVQLFNATGATVVLPSEVSQDYYLFFVKTTGDVQEVRAYEAMADVDADTEVAAHRVFDWWPTNSAGQGRAGVLKSRVKWWSRFTENTINSMTAPPTGIATAINISSSVPVSLVDEILFGAQNTTNSTTSYLSGVTGTVQTSVTGSVLLIAAGEAYEWGDPTRPGLFIPIMGDNVYWGKAGSTPAASTVQLAIHAIKWRI